MMLSSLIFFTSLCLATTSGNRDVVFNVYLWWGNEVDIVFSLDKFEEFLACFCASENQNCVTEYDTQNGNQVTNIEIKGRGIRDTDDDPRYYQCFVEHWHERYNKLVCQFQNDAQACTRKDRNLQAFRIENSTCDFLCIGLIWRDEFYIKYVDFYNTKTNVIFFNDSCLCPAVTSPTTTSTTPLPQTSSSSTTITTETLTTTSAATPATATTTELPTVTGTKIPSTPSSTETFPVFATTVQTSSKEPKEDMPLGVIIGVVIAVILIALIVALVAFLVRKRKQKQNGPKQQVSITSLDNLNNVRPAPQNGVTNINNVSPYAVHTLSSNYYSLTEGNNSTVTSDVAPLYAKAMNGSSSGRANAISQHSNKTIQDDFTAKDLKKSKTYDNLASEKCLNKARGTETGNNYVNTKSNMKDTVIKTIPESAATRYELAQLVNENGDVLDEHSAALNVSKQYSSETNANCSNCAISYTQDANETAVHGEKTSMNDHKTTSISSYKHTGRIESHNKDFGYDYAEPEYSCDAVTNNKSVQLNNTNNNSNNEEAHDRGHKIDTTYSLAGNINSSSTQNEADNSTHIYSRLHEENRRLQNPYNTLLEPNEADTTHTSMSGSAHISQAANQPSCYSFAQPIFNEKEDNNIGFKDDAMSWNHTYYVLEASEKQVSGGEEHNCDVTDKKQNIYFELEKQEDISDSDVEA